jgi:amphi-Trp domain-containing protein
MPQHRSRDLERTYSRPQFVAKLRRLADALEVGAPFTIQVAGERLRLPADVAFNIEHERAGRVDELEFPDPAGGRHGPHVARQALSGRPPRGR